MNLYRDARLVEAGLPQESAAICFKSKAKHRGGGVWMGCGGSGGGGLVAALKKNGVHHVKAGGRVDSKRFSCLLSGGRRSN